MSEIKMPMDVANAVIDAIGWLFSDGQSFTDKNGGTKLSQWLLDNYADHPDMESWLGDTLRDFIFMQQPMKPSV